MCFIKEVCLVRGKSRYPTVKWVLHIRHILPSSCVRLDRFGVSSVRHLFNSIVIGLVWSDVWLRLYWCCYNCLRLYPLWSILCCCYNLLHCCQYNFPRLYIPPVQVFWSMSYGFVGFSRTSTGIGLSSMLPKSSSKSGNFREYTFIRFRHDHHSLARPCTRLSTFLKFFSYKLACHTMDGPHQPYNVFLVFPLVPPFTDVTCLNEFPHICIYSDPLVYRC